MFSIIKNDSYKLKHDTISQELIFGSNESINNDNGRPKSTNPYEDNMSSWGLKCLGIFSIGVASGTGVALMFFRSHENYKFTWKKNRGGALLATQAFLYGSAIACSAFGIGIWSFFTATGIKSSRELKIFMYKTLEPIAPSIFMTSDDIKEKELLMTLDEEHEYKYLFKKYLGDWSDELEQDLQKEKEDFAKKHGTSVEDYIEKQKIVINEKGEEVLTEEGYNEISEKKDRSLKEHFQYLKQKYYKKLFK